ncbi:MAG: S8 family serine peptidase [Saprospiraceae bacterium]|nr:S8 family serine peptidase [Saprospiraceae bacterium]
MILRLLTFLFFIALGATSLKAQNDFDVSIRGKIYSPQPNIAGFEPSEVNPLDIVANRYYRFIQFNDVLSSEAISELKQNGIHVLSFIPPQTYIVSIQTTTTKSKLEQLNVRSIWEITAEQRIVDDIRNRSLPDWAIDGKKAKLLVKYYKDLDQDVVIDLLKKEKIEVIEYNGYNNFLQISTDLDRLDELNDLAFLENVEPILGPGIKEDLRARALHRVNKLDPNFVGGREYTGEGVTVLVRDDGFLFDHIDFSGRLDQSFSTPSTGGHGDGVAGILAGAGNLEPLYKGMAHESFVYVKRYVGSFLDETMSLFFNRDAIVTNSSYGQVCNIGYTNAAQTVDQQTYENPTLMHVFSAGNSGQGVLDNNDNLVECGYGAGLVWGNITGGHKQGKNVIATANLSPRGEIMNSSSRGPAYDGRIKPDIAANGHNHISTAESNDYISFSGTSGAAPVIAGAMAMLHQAYKINHGERAKAPLLKAMMLNTATDLGNKGPDFIHGWGSLNAHRAVLGIEEGRFLNAIINQDEQKTHTITIPENVAEVRIMTYWPDPEASSFSSVALINDLNTVLKSPDDTEFMPWVLDPTPDPNILSLPASKGVDNLNNMEQIAIDNPSAGDYTLEINGDQVPFGTNEYFIVWEFKMNEIDIMFPDGGETLNQRTTETIHWEAAGDVGQFTLTFIDEQGNESAIGTASGNARTFQWLTPEGFSEKSKIRIERNGLMDESTDYFLLANIPKNLEVTFDDNRKATMINWESDSIPVSFNIYAQGEFVMEKKVTVEGNSYEFPDDPENQFQWFSVSANYQDGTEGRRTRAVSTTPNPIAVVVNNKDNKPCVNQPIVFESLSTDTLLRYTWNFGSNAEPSEANTPGPHTVFYTKAQPTAGIMVVANDGGEDDSFFAIFPQSDLESKESELINEGGGTYTFKSKIVGANTYTWDFGDGNTGSGKTVSHTYEESGTFTVILDAENSCGSITEMSEVSINLTNVKDLTVEDFVISPNPNQGDFYITLPDVEGNELNIDLISIDGKLLDSKRILNGSSGQVVAWNGIQTGVYVMKFRLGLKEISTKIVVN